MAIPFTNISTGASSYKWLYGDGDSSLLSSPQHTYFNTSSSNQNYLAQLIATSNKGCVDTLSRPILVYPKPIANFTVSDSVSCQPVSIQFNNLSSLGDSCYWSYGDGADLVSCGAANSHLYSNTTSFVPVDYLAQLFVNTNSGCRDTISKSIRIYPAINADFTSDTAGCTPFPVQFQNLSNGAQTFQWTFGNGNSGNGLKPPINFL